MRYMEMRMATVTKTLALKIGQVKYVPATSTPAPRLGSQIIWNLLEDSPMERIKKRVQMIPLHSILKTVKAKKFNISTSSKRKALSPKQVFHSSL